MAVSKRTRFEVLRRDNFTCRYCRSTEESLKVDHVIPVALGGSDAPDNLVAACHDCNAGKSSTSLEASMVADISQRAVEWGQAITAFNAAQMADRKKRDAYVRKFEKAWNSWAWGPEENRKRVPRPGDWKATIWQFYGLGLPIGELEDAVTIACGHQTVELERTFRYMCGVLWNKVNEMQDGAKSFMGASD